MDNEINEDNCCQTFNHQNRKATHTRKSMMEGKSPVKMCYECYEVASTTSNLSKLLIGEIGD